MENVLLMALELGHLVFWLEIRQADGALGILIHIFRLIRKVLVTEVIHGSICLDSLPFCFLILIWHAEVARKADKDRASHDVENHIEVAKNEVASGCLEKRGTARLVRQMSALHRLI